MKGPRPERESFSTSTAHGGAADGMGNGARNHGRIADDRLGADCPLPTAQAGVGRLGSRGGEAFGRRETMVLRTAAL